MSITIFREGSELADGRYRLDRRLGTGGMATVWLALDTRLARSVAIKLPSDALTADETFSIRFEREAQTAAALSHPYLVSVFDYGTEGDRPYLVSEYIDGSNLAQLRERMRPPETEILAKTLLEALAHIHAAGIVHRDVKPGNVLVDRVGRILLTDFGIAQSTEETSLTATGHVVGTRSYIAPEVMRGERAGPPADLYALGVLLAEQLTDEDPDRVARIAHALKQDEPADRPRNAERALELLERRSVVVAPTERIALSGDQTAPTAPTARRDPPSRRTVPPPLPPVAPAPERRRGFQRTPLVAGLAALVVAIIIGVAIIAGGGDGGDPGRAGSGGTTGGAEPSTEADASAVPSTATTETTTPAETTEETTTTEPAATDSARAIALNNEGFALLQEGDIEGALPKLQGAVASFPSDSTEIDHAFALFNYAQALRLSGDPAAAIPLLEKRLSFSDFKVEEVQAELALAQEAAGEKVKPAKEPKD